MNDRHAIVAFLGALLAIVILAVCGTIAAKSGKDISVYAGAITGLIGVIGTFKPRAPTSNVERADTVNQGDVK